MDMSLSKLRELMMHREAWSAVVYGVAKSWTWLRDWTELNWFIAYIHVNSPSHVKMPKGNKRYTEKTRPPALSQRPPASLLTASYYSHLLCFLSGLFNAETQSSSPSPCGSLTLGQVYYWFWTGPYFFWTWQYTWEFPSHSYFKNIFNCYTKKQKTIKK